MFAVATSGARDDDTGVDLAGVAGDLAGRPPLADGDRYCTVGRLLNGCERLLGLFVERAAHLLVDVLRERVHAPRVDDVQRVDRGIEGRREVQRGVDGAAAALGAVRRDNDRIEHTLQSAGGDINLNAARDRESYLLTGRGSGMHLGVIGLGRMGRIVADRTLAAGHDVTAFDVSDDALAAAADAGIEPADSIDDLAELLGKEKRLWLMVPAGDPVDAALDELDPYLSADDIVVDGGNSYFADSTRRAESTPARYLDCGTSGGPASAEAGFSLMIGGPQTAYETMTPVFDAVATGPDGHDRMGAAGAGHYVKMVHNGVEYALMQAYGEGFELLHEGRYDLDLEAVARTWNNGAVVRSWLLELCEEAFREEGSDLGDVADHVAGGSTGTWTVQEALEQEVAVPLIYEALAERFDSRVAAKFSRRLANRLRYGFGRHEIMRE